MAVNHRIGFMQGRLSEQVDGKIQCFPWDEWEAEFARASQIGVQLMEWTIDHDRLNENPLMTESGRKRIRELSDAHNVHVVSLTGDCFMQAPFWKTRGSERLKLQQDFEDVVLACGDLGIGKIVVPLVDNGAPENSAHEKCLLSFLSDIAQTLKRLSVSIVFECEYEPQKCAKFIDKLPEHLFGINYDIGNSASLGFDPVQEFANYGHRIKNVHVKDRRLRGATVPLGQGDANFQLVFALLAALHYDGNYILQTARAEPGEHIGAIDRYAKLVAGWIDHATRS